MYMDKNFIDSMKQQIIFSGLNQDGQYVYSDFGFIMLAEIIRNETGVTLDKYVDSVFYQPLGLNRLDSIRCSGFHLMKLFLRKMMIISVASASRGMCMT